MVDNQDALFHVRPLGSLEDCYWSARALENITMRKYDNRCISKCIHDIISTEIYTCILIFQIYNKTGCKD